MPWRAELIDRVHRHRRAKLELLPYRSLRVSKAMAFEQFYRPLSLQFHGAAASARAAVPNPGPGRGTHQDRSAFRMRGDTGGGVDSVSPQIERVLAPAHNPSDHGAAMNPDTDCPAGPEPLRGLDHRPRTPHRGQHAVLHRMKKPRSGKERISDGLYLLHGTRINDVFERVDKSAELGHDLFRRMAIAVPSESDDVAEQYRDVLQAAGLDLVGRLSSATALGGRMACNN